ncbi:helix-turn-helix transcriptional regulator [Rhizobium sp. SSA_523]|uniref:helix-turn-helix domain-containing protein n=1 Tax=Rhizobium sp. SSA_523 TaxID=2952477 RepID=UPI002090F9A3|nr:helix-turn-helix transcriptional regulator [Rhizobium sp. SSA_523]MCO5732017.1 helix-turn-helix transcriptional regulator [Rhizobium sp. SSA_523]WKC22643.1 helix-turn-helix transcriptional regulator [Rhizobium sp. SSA_523]
MTIAQNNIESVSSVSIASTLADARRAAGYSLDDLAITCGLTVDELEAIEGGSDLDPARLQRVASALQLRQLIL